MMAGSLTFDWAPEAAPVRVIVDALTRALGVGGLIVQREAQQIVPVDTGNLRDSIQVSESSDDGSRVSVDVYTDVPYAGYVEYGTGQRGAASPGAGEGPYNPNWPGMAAQPYMRPALDTSRPEILQVAKEELDAA